MWNAPTSRSQLLVEHRHQPASYPQQGDSAREPLLIDVTRSERSPRPPAILHDVSQVPLIVLAQFGERPGLEPFPTVAATTCCP